MWFTEAAWPPIILCLALAAIAAGLWNAQRKGWMLALAGVLVAACPVIWVVERQIVTPAEEIELAVHDLAAAVRDGDVDTTVSYLSPQLPALQAAVRSAMAIADIGDDLRITDLSVRMTSADTRAISHFRANATIRAHAMQHEAHHPTRWELTWQRQEGNWKVVAIERLDPINGERVSWWSAQ